jgi:hypothetical protein
MPKEEPKPKEQAKPKDQQKPQEQPPKKMMKKGKSPPRA